MPQTPLNTLADLNAISTDLDTTQSCIEEARALADKADVSAFFYHELELAQLRVNKKRSIIEIIMGSIASRN